MIGTLYRHSPLKKGYMMDWLRHCAEHHMAPPSDEAIADRFNFRSVEDARTLLADLADCGEIMVRQNGKGREISLSPEKPKAFARTPTPIGRTVKHPARRRKGEASEAETLSKIMGIVRREKPGPTPAPEPASPPPAPEQSEPAVTRDKRVQLNLRPSAETFDKVKALADKEGVTPGRMGLRLLERALAHDAPPVEAKAEPEVGIGGKPRVRAIVVKKAGEAGIGLHEFCGLLIDLGFEAWTARRDTAP